MFTHSVVFKLGDGGKFITAQFSFAKEGAISVLINQTSVPLPIDFFKDFNNFADELSRLFTKYDGIKTISCVENGTEAIAVADITEAAEDIKEK